MCLSLCAVPAARATSQTYEDILNLVALNDALENGPTKTIGFLSEGNYLSVKHELSSVTEPLYYSTKDELYDAVKDGSVLGSLTSGTHEDPDLHTFGSEQISLHAMFTRRDSPLINAIDRALVNIIERGGVEEVARQNSPYRALVAHSCSPSSDHFDWPLLQNNTVITVAALGPYNWGTYDGDYTTTPYTGFWPDYYEEIRAEFLRQYNITFVRKWYSTSTALLQSINEQETNVTEPYMIVGSSHAGLSRKSSFEISCITSATQNLYFTAKSVSSEAAGDSGRDSTSKKSTNQGLMIGVLCACAALAAMCFAMAVTIKQERAGNPLFVPVSMDDV